MKAVGELLLVLALSSLGALATWQIAGPPSRAIPCDPATLSPEEICIATVQAEWPEGTFLWIDARTEEEWRANGMPGSVHLTTVGSVPFDAQIEASLEQLALAPRAVVYCSTSGCGISKEVVKQLGAKGMIPELRALHGGWDALKQAGLIKDSSSGH